MRLWIQSDQHMEMYGVDKNWTVPDADVFVCAGDLTRPLKEGVRWLEENVAPHMPVIYTAGNHEFYRSFLSEGLEEGMEASDRSSRVHLLENSIRVIDGVRFIGCTLWTDFSIMGEQGLAIMHAGQAMNDYKLIGNRKQPYEKLRPRHTQTRHFQSRSFLEAALRMRFEGKTVVVTHHCPHPMSMHRKFDGDLLNAAFCSDLSGLIEQEEPDLWIHGHTHESFDYMVGSTRVLCNPRGYGDENNGFRPTLVIDL